MLKNAVMRYIVYIIYFLGIGMVSSGIVLMPFNTSRYGAILIVGLLLFSTGSFINEIVLEKKQMTTKERFKLIAVSLSLAIGIGMISGGIAHFKESPNYVTYLIPLGLIISFISFMIKNNIQFTKKEKMGVVIALTLISFTVHTSLSVAATKMLNTNEGGDIFKSHGM